ncbi:MAG: ribosome recycling factor [Candidatus Berkelbacteria bacterium]|nr:ribosome recycling factor [Candidatus Berkelbacteria bacterium]
MLNEILKKIEPKIESAILNFDSELRNIRTGRANASLVEDIEVIYYGAKTALKQLASITIPEPTSLLISPWDKQALGDVEIAIRNSELNLSVVNDGANIRINLPPLTGERREELSKLVKKNGEEARIQIRNIRGEAWEEIQKAEKSKTISEDEKYRGEKELNQIVEKKNQLIEEKVRQKISELNKI